jgi:prevent-host-death family protein
LRRFGSFEAKNKLSQLLELAEQGEEILITRHGKEVAKLVPVHRTLDRESAKRTAAEIREMRRGVTLGGLQIKDLINEGRK